MATLALEPTRTSFVTAMSLVRYFPTKLTRCNISDAGDLLGPGLDVIVTDDADPRFASQELAGMTSIVTARLVAFAPRRRLYLRVLDTVAAPAITYLDALVVGRVAKTKLSRGRRHPRNRFAAVAARTGCGHHVKRLLSIMTGGPAVLHGRTWHHEFRLG